MKVDCSIRSWRIIRTEGNYAMNRILWPGSTWPQLDLEIMTALACQVRVLSELQIEQGWQSRWALNDVRESLSKLVAARLVRKEGWTVVPPQIGNTPLHTWKPGHLKPDTWRLSQTCRSRWNRLQENLTVFQGTELAGRLFGSRAGHETRVIERRHDLLLGEVFILYRKRLPELAKRWVGENAVPMAEHGVKNPDAFLMDDENVPRRVIESAGSYSQSQVETFHEYCRVSRLPYELW